MKIETLRLLQELQKKYGVKGSPSGPPGKIVQKLLALCFHEMGFINIVERSVQGADIDITKPPDQKFTLEVKTTEGLSIPISSDNVDALRDRTKDGYLPLIAALRLSPLEDWILAKIPIEKILIRKVLIDSLRIYRMTNLESQLSYIFDKVVQNHFHETINGGEQYLKGQLKQVGIIAKEV